MNIIDEIRKVALALPGPPKFYYAGNPEHNAKDEVGYFTAIVNLLEYDELDFTIQPTGSIKDSPKSFIRFLTLEDEIDNPAEVRLPTIDAMRNLARLFLIMINRGDVFEPVIGRVPVVQITNFGDSNASGVELQLNLTLVKPNSNCFI